MTSKWIPCSKKLPEPYNKVLIAPSWGGIEIAWLTDLSYWSSECYNYGNAEVLAWVPLPKPYKEEKEDEKTIPQS